MTELTPGQQDREDLLMNLEKAVVIASYELDYSITIDMILWLRLEDWNSGIFDMQRLLDEGCLLYDATQHPLGNTGLDRFAPRAYQLTEKGYKILTQKSQWVFEGVLQ